MGIVFTCKTYGGAKGSGPAGTADAMYIILGIFRKILLVQSLFRSTGCIPDDPGAGLGGGPGHGSKAAPGARRWGRPGWG